MKRKTCISAIASLSLLASAQASAEIVELSVIAVASQVSQTPTGLVGEVRLGTTTVARTSFWPLWHTLSAGAGFTMQCTSSGFSIKAERAFQASDAGTITLVVTAPITVPTRYSIPGWLSVDEGTCPECAMQYTGQAVETAAGITISGTGASFQLSASGASSLSDTMLFYVCKEEPCDEETP
jgi:hypothetical protein